MSDAIHNKHQMKNRYREIQILRNLVKGDSDLVTPLDDGFLLKFLHARKFDPERALHLLQKYYRLRAANPTLFYNFLPSAVNDVLLITFKDSYFIGLPLVQLFLSSERNKISNKRFIVGYISNSSIIPKRTFLISVGLWNTSKYDANEIFRTNMMCLEMAVRDTVTQENGIAAIIDLRGFGLFPARFNAIHFVNESNLFGVMFNLVKPLLSEKLKKRIHFHGTNFRSLHQHIPADILPSDYGGNLDLFSNKTWYSNMRKSEDFFNRNNRYGYKTP
ncbi:alpha-tocopherol transfer protein-like [Tachypleus tridentatus]|uniref:alpha-tocopherol transfer protein-like n=1 Tax=Tachypleus tridentatus TaxID=6853 RepID=UPI003FD0E96A